MLEALASSGPTPIGRQREFASLWHHVQAAADGHMGVVLVAGEPGIGKTHILEAFAARS